MTLKCIAQNSDRSVSIVNGRFSFKSDLSAAIQIIDNVVRSRLGEYKYNKTKGIDYLDNIFGTNPNYQRFESDIRRNVLNLDFVTSIQSFEYNVNYELGELKYVMEVKTTFDINPITVTG